MKVKVINVYNLTERSSEGSCEVREPQEAREGSRLWYRGSIAYLLPSTFP